ncbi:hypothetical protein CLOSBL3_11252 [Clostridiaceae bacterium BL-3]|nr:hypothetical protein CLOSBL3_11252 [Clostridiaceae bacterium BL-3]
MIYFNYILFNIYKNSIIFVNDNAVFVLFNIIFFGFTLQNGSRL